MKVTGLNGKGKGKLGAEVYSINHGVQIRREYNGEISNPSTANQVSQRSRFKLMSQLSAVFAPVLAFRRKSLQSPRNLFTQKNMQYVYGDVNGAIVTYENLQLAPGSIPLGRLTVNRGTNSAIAFGVAGTPEQYLDKLVFCAFRKDDTSQLVYRKSWVFDAKSVGGLGLYVPSNPTFTPSPEQTYVFFVYGVRFNNDRARGKYGEYSVADAADFAQLISNRTLSESDLAFSETRGVTLLAQQSATVDPEANQRVLYISTNTLGRVGVRIEGGEEQVTEGGAFVATVGSEITLYAKKLSDTSPNYNFLGWYDNGVQTPFSRETTITIILDRQRDIIARWEATVGLE